MVLVKGANILHSRIIFKKNELQKLKKCPLVESCSCKPTSFFLWFKLLTMLLIRTTFIFITSHVPEL